MEKRQTVIYLISDSIGETAQSLIAAVSSQFPSLEPFDIHRFPFINQADKLLKILKAAKAHNAIVVHTLVTKELTQIAEQFSKEQGLPALDVMSPLTNMIGEATGIQALEQAGMLRKMDESYFNRVAAIEFSVKYDDGKDPRGFLLADVVILGISRTSKTPVSIYLANRGFRVANLPLVPEAELPKELFEVPHGRIIGLTSGLNAISRIRRTRAEALGLLGENEYSKVTRVREELSFAHVIFEELSAYVIDVENKAIEEVAALIEAHIGVRGIEEAY